MRNRILIVDNLVSHAIQLKVKLAKSLYEVELAGGLDLAREVIASRHLLLVLVSERVASTEQLQQFCAESSALRGGPPVLVFGHGDGTEDRGAHARRALAAGAQEYLTLPVDEATLMARVRSLVRQGFNRWALPSPEPAGPLAPKAEQMVALVGPLSSEAVSWRQHLDGILPFPVKVMRIGDLMAVLRRRELPAAAILAAPEAQMSDLRLLAELKARLDTADLPVIVLGGAGGDFAVLALDLGAHDVLPLNFDPEELALRLRLRLAQRQQNQARLLETTEQLRLAAVDPLTGLANRRATMQRLERLQQEFSRGGTSYVLLLLDIDRFKQVNDRYGHGAGDAVLKLVGEKIASVVRGGDLLGRIGGEEFLVALEGASLSEGCRIAERLRQVVAKTPYAVSDDLTIGITVSIGLSQPMPMEPPESVLERADRALYSAKDLGRNMVEVFV